MDTEQAIKLQRVRQRIEATDADLSGSTFNDVNLAGATFNDVDLAGASVSNANLSGWHMRNVNLSGLRISHADLRNASIVESLTEGMTIDGIAVADLLVTYHAAHAKAG